MPKGNRTTWGCLAALAVTLALCAAGWFLLPDQVALQIGLDGALGNYVPKPVALLLPLGLGALGTGLSTGESRRRTGLILAVLAPVLPIVTLILNR